MQYYGTAQITVPDLTGMSPAAAQAALTSKGLVPAPSPDEVTNQPNVVHSQSPAAATAVASGTQVQYVYEDAAPVPLYLHKRAGDPFYLLSTEASVAGYSNQRSLGNVFPA
ncbi:PASTA domain-containing protein, partial [Frankia sp. CpI1-P]|uniref:PASTA domain-containing protein n=1 Tax=Frankia sp. CpI1-P TaxID=1502734 RepID=UPI0037C10043